MPNFVLIHLPGEKRQAKPNVVDKKTVLIAIGRQFHLVCCVKPWSSRCKAWIPWLSWSIWQRVTSGKGSQKSLRPWSFPTTTSDRLATAHLEPLTSGKHVKLTASFDLHFLSHYHAWQIYLFPFLHSLSHLQVALWTKRAQSSSIKRTEHWCWRS